MRELAIARYDASVKRWLFNLPAALSLILCVALMALWVLDTRRGHFVVVAGGRAEPVNLGRGILFEKRDPTDDPQLIVVVVDRHLHFAGVHYMAQGTRYGMLFVPYWMPALLLVILPACWVVHFTTHRRRHSSGRCPTCGYDLRATPERCPECGAVPAVK